MGYVIGLAIALGVCVLGYQVLLLISYNLTLLLDAALPVPHGLSPAVAWLLIGAIAGAMVGVYRSARRYEAPYLRPVAIIALVILTAIVGQNAYAVIQARTPRMPTAAAASAHSVRLATVVASGGANLRARPSTSSARVALLPGGARVEVVGGTGDWFQVVYQSAGGARQGYMHASVLRLDQR